MIGSQNILFHEGKICQWDFLDLFFVLIFVINQVFFLLPITLHYILTDVMLVYTAPPKGTLNMSKLDKYSTEFANTRGQEHFGVFEHFGSNLGLTGTYLISTVSFSLEKNIGFINEIEG